MKNLQFKVDLRGIIDLLSEHIYTTPTVFVRELLQNAVDAIQAKKLYDEHFEGQIKVSLRNNNGHQIIFSDNGIGLTQEEIYEFLSVIGESSKRNHAFEDNFIGKFGIGLLSGFVVSDEIIVQTKSEAENVGYIWQAKADGTYSLEESSEEIPVGSSVILNAKPSMFYYFQSKTIIELLGHYGEALPYPIHFESEQENLVINPETPIWLQDYATTEDLLVYGKQKLQQEFIEAFPVEIEALGLKGTAFISAKKRHINSKNESKVFVKKMLLSEKIENLLPNWGFFITTVLNIDELTPTASREDFVKDANYNICKELLADFFKEYLKKVSQENPELFTTILNTHYQSIKMLANEDDTLLELFIDYLIFETNRGRKSLLWIRENIAEINYTPSLEDFKQIRRIAQAKDVFVLNAAYSFEANLMENIQRKYPTLNIRKISPLDILNAFETVSPEEFETYQGFIQEANKVMQTHFCEVSVKKFQPTDLPVLLIADEEGISNYQTQKLSQDKANPFADILQTQTQGKQPNVCFNANNQLIQSLRQQYESGFFKSIIEMLYVQSLFLGQFPVNKKEMEILNVSLINIINHKIN